MVIFIYVLYQGCKRVAHLVMLSVLGSWFSLIVERSLPTKIYALVSGTLSPHRKVLYAQIPWAPLQLWIYLGRHYLDMSSVCSVFTRIMGWTGLPTLISYHIWTCRHGKGCESLIQARMSSSMSERFNVALSINTLVLSLWCNDILKIAYPCQIHIVRQSLL